MADRTLIERVEILEKHVQALETLPTRVTAVKLQIMQLRNEMRIEFSAVRQEMSAMGAGLRQEIRTVDAALREEVRAGDEETRRYMRVLHEEVIGRFATIQEGRRGPKKK